MQYLLTLTPDWLVLAIRQAGIGRNCRGKKGFLGCSRDDIRNGTSRVFHTGEDDVSEQGPPATSMKSTACMLDRSFIMSSV